MRSSCWEEHRRGKANGQIVLPQTEKRKRPKSAALKSCIAGAKKLRAREEKICELAKRFDVASKDHS